MKAVVRNFSGQWRALVWRVGQGLWLCGLQGTSTTGLCKFSIHLPFDVGSDGIARLMAAGWEEAGVLTSDGVSTHSPPS
jgi:hypothetical protein